MTRSCVKKISVNDFQNDEYILDVLRTDTVYIQQDNGISYSIKGDLCDEGIWTDLCLIDSSNYNFSTSAATKGTYIVDVSNFNSIKFILDQAEQDSSLTIKVVGDLW